MAEHLTRNEKVVGSIPTISSKKKGAVKKVPSKREAVPEGAACKK